MSLRALRTLSCCTAAYFLADRYAPAQVPAVPTAAAPTKNIYTFLLPSPEQRAACKAKVAACPPAQLLNAILKPAGVLTGGLVPPLIPPGPTPADLAKSSETDAGAAAKIKARQADAKARRSNVRYLGTVDCRYYPEAEKVLTEALRKDPSECVRFEAALALNCGCCTKKTTEALKAAAGLATDQAPPECSERVRAAAERALARCEAVGPPPAPQRPVEKPLPSGVEPVVALIVTPAGGTTAALAGHRSMDVPTGQRGLFQILRRTYDPSATSMGR